MLAGMFIPPNPMRFSAEHILVTGYADSRMARGEHERREERGLDMSAVKQAVIVLMSTLAIIALMLGASSLFFGVPFPSPLAASGSSVLYECPECGQVHEHKSATIEMLDEDGHEREPIKAVPIELTKTERIERLQDRLAAAEAESARIAAEKAAAEEESRRKAEEEAAAEAARQAELEAQAAAEAQYASGTSPAPTLSAMQISFLGTTNSYIDTPFWGSAPTHGAGLWAGSDSTTDGSWGYFIGHHPGDFYAVMNLGVGDVIKVCDRNGNSRSYSVVDAFTIPDTTWWEDLQARVCGYGESVILQTCVGNGYQYRIVVAA